MPRPLLVTADTVFLDDLIDRLGPEIEFDHSAAPTAGAWRAATVVLVDGRRPGVLRRLPTRPHRAVLVGQTWVTDPDTWAGLGAATYRWPSQVDAVRGLITAAADRQPDAVRLGVAGAHGGAGATTLAAALILAGCDHYRWVTGIEIERDGERLGSRLGDGDDPRLDRIHLVGPDQVPARVCEPLDLGERPESELVVFDLGRAADRTGLAWARTCDLVFVVADAVRNRRATRTALRTLTEAGVPVALVARRMVDQTADLLAGDFTVPVAGDVHVDEWCFAVDGSIREPRAGTLLAVASDLLSQVPALIAEATTR